MEKQESLLEYYRASQFNPVELPIEQRERFLDHLAKRSNLYQAALGLPLRWLDGKRVLEVGCASGENALVLALHGARLTLVEPNEYAHARLLTLFERFGVRDRLEQLETVTIEQYRADATFELVVAEGFLDVLRTREQVIGRLCALVAPGGLCVVTRHDGVGMLMESLKLAVVRRAVRLAGAQESEAERLAIAETLFREDFERIPHSRSFRAWWKDVLDSPLFDEFVLWKFEDMLRLFVAGQCRYYSSQPDYREPDKVRWYKDVPSVEEAEEALLEGYTRRAPSFAFAGPLFRERKLSLKRSRWLRQKLEELTRALARWAAQPVAPAPRAPWLLELEQQLEASFADGIEQRVRELCRLLDGLEGESSEQLVREYLSCERLRQTWGAPLHYVCFVKDVAEDLCGREEERQHE